MNTKQQRRWGCKPKRTIKTNAVPTAVEHQKRVLVSIVSKTSWPTSRRGRVGSEMAEKNAVWIVYDGRALFGDTNDAAVLESFSYPDCKDDVDAKRQARRTWKGHEFALYRYDLNEKREAHGERLILAHKI